MSKHCRIALFFVQPTSVTSLAIALGTLCQFTHCAVEIDGRWYDASESRGDFGPMNFTKQANRKCLLIQQVEASADLLSELKGKKYDWSGIRRWLPGRLLGRFNKQLTLTGNKDPYCFEVGHLALMDGWNDSPVSGCDLLSIAEQRGLPVRYGKFGALV